MVIHVGKNEGHCDRFVDLGKAIFFVPTLRASIGADGTAKILYLFAVIIWLFHIDAIDFT